MPLTTRMAELVSLSDEELVRQTYALVDRVDDDSLSGEFFFLLAEAFERFAPEAEWANVEREALEYWPVDSEEEREVELASALEYFRERQAARLILRAFERDDLGEGGQR